MLSHNKKEDIEARYRDVELAVETWRSLRERVSDQLREEFASKLIISRIYHDSALEGEVLSHGEIKASIDTKIISDPSLIPAYDSIRRLSTAIGLASQLASKRKAPAIDQIKELHAELEKGEPDSAGAYRKDNPLHRLYYHTIATPEKISYQMRKLAEWIDSDAVRSLHPIDRAAQVHWRLMGIFPWKFHTGHVARLAANMFLEHDDYPIAVIHSIDRQRYYEALRAPDTESLLIVYLEGVETMAGSATRVYEEALRSGVGRRAS